MERATAHDIFTSIQAAARREMERSSVGLFFSGLAGGLNISFGFIGTAVATAQAPDPFKVLLATLAYPLGFLLVILPRAQLFTENTLTPVLLVLEHPKVRTITGTLRIWGVVLLANLIGAFIASQLLAHFTVGTRLLPSAMHEIAMHSYEGGWGEHFLRGIFGAWLVALLVWMLHTGASPVGEAVLIWLTTAPIFFAGFNHSVAGAVEGMYLANTGVITYVQWLWDFQIPVTLGNATGGVFFVALVNWGQAVGAGSDVAVAERQKVVRRVHEQVETAEAKAAAKDLVKREEIDHLKRRLTSDGEKAGEIVSDALDRSDVKTEARDEIAPRNQPGNGEESQ